MFGFASSLAIGYLALTGTIANSAILARGFKRAFDAAVKGDMREARSYVFSAVSAPAIIAITAVGAFVGECIRGSNDLGEPVLKVIHG
ncbi:MAG: hypothetical protein K8T89_06285 [Planctomycetes bacterium]|nr:hypothetical protein [Planctomycetota bacterium]